MQVQHPILYNYSSYFNVAATLQETSIGPVVTTDAPQNADGHSTTDIPCLSDTDDDTETGQPCSKKMKTSEN